MPSGVVDALDESKEDGEAVSGGVKLWAGSEWPRLCSRGDDLKKVGREAWPLISENGQCPIHAGNNLQLERVIGAMRDAAMPLSTQTLHLVGQLLQLKEKMRYSTEQLPEQNNAGGE